MQTGNQEHCNRQRVPKQSGKELSTDDDELQPVFARIQVFKSTTSISITEISNITGWKEENHNFN